MNTKMWNLSIFLFLTSSDRHLGQKHTQTQQNTSKKTNLTCLLVHSYRSHPHHKKANLSKEEPMRIDMQMDAFMDQLIKSDQFSNFTDIIAEKAALKVLAREKPIVRQSTQNEKDNEEKGIEGAELKTEDTILLTFNMSKPSPDTNIEDETVKFHPKTRYEDKNESNLNGKDLDDKDPKKLNPDREDTTQKIDTEPLELNKTVDPISLEINSSQNKTDIDKIQLKDQSGIENTTATLRNDQSINFSEKNDQVKDIMETTTVDSNLKETNKKKTKKKDKKTHDSDSSDLEIIVKEIDKKHKLKKEETKVRAVENKKDPIKEISTKKHKKHEPKIHKTKQLLNETTSKHHTKHKHKKSIDKKEEKVEDTTEASTVIAIDDKQNEETQKSQSSSEHTGSQDKSKAVKTKTKLSKTNDTTDSSEEVGKQETPSTERDSTTKYGGRPGSDEIEHVQSISDKESVSHDVPNKQSDKSQEDSFEDKSETKESRENSETKETQSQEFTTEEDSRNSKEVKLDSVSMTQYPTSSENLEIIDVTQNKTSLDTNESKQSKEKFTETTNNGHIGKSKENNSVIKPESYRAHQDKKKNKRKPILPIDKEDSGDGLAGLLEKLMDINTNDTKPHKKSRKESSSQSSEKITEDEEENGRRYFI